MKDDWDLHAVVRSCSASNTTATATISSSGSATTSSSSNFQPRQDDNNNNSLFCFQDLLEHPRILTKNSSTSTDFEELHELCKPFFTESEKLLPISPPMRLLPISPISVLGHLQDLQPSQQQQQQHQLTNTRLIQPKRLLSVNGSTTCTLHAQSPRTKRRKNQLKKVCQVAADALSSDMWSWRKYGQKPIKGSPYPRGYYKCSTSKGCLARKQVERNRSDPNMFIVTYTAEHNHPMPTHRNSLAGISRHKAANSNKPTSSSPVYSPAINSPAPENQESSSRDEKEDIFEDADDEFGVSDVGLDKIKIPDDDFFEGLDDLEIPATGEIWPEKFPGSLQFPWMANKAATTADGVVDLL